MPKRSHVAAFIVLCVLTVVGVLFALDRMTSVTGLEQTEARDLLGWTELDEPVTVRDLGGLGEVNTDQRPNLDGVVVMNLWASWCDPCREEMPWLQALADDGVAVIGVSRDHHADRAEQMLELAEVSYPNYLDAGSVVHNALDGEIPLQGIPTSILIEDGVVTWVHVGVFASYADLRDGVSKRVGRAS